MKNKNVVIGIIVAVIVVVLGGGGFFLYQNSQKKEVVTASAERQTESDNLSSDTVLYNGQEYKMNSDIETILFMGVDKKNQEMLEESPVNAGQTDCMILFVMNKETKKTQLIQIPRESMVDVDEYDENGEFTQTRNEQICLQYAYGDGKTRSCWLTKNVVSALFYNIPINGCVALNVEGFSLLTTAIGGIDITIPQDYTEIDPSFTQGAQLNLSGDLALKYVQYRNTEEFGSNNGRMERQTQFLKALAHQLKTKYGSGNDYTALMNVANPYMVTDLEGEKIKQLASYDLDENTMTVPGESVEAFDHDQYKVNQDELYKMVLDVFYTPVDKQDTEKE